MEKYHKFINIVNEHNLTSVYEYSDINDLIELKSSLLTSKYRELIDKKYLDILMARPIQSHSKRVLIDGVVYNSITEAAKKFAVDRNVIKYRIKSKSDKFSTYNYE